jgi:hypothetical protein
MNDYFADGTIFAGGAEATYLIVEEDQVNSGPKRL